MIRISASPSLFAALLCFVLVSPGIAQAREAQSTTLSGAQVCLVVGISDGDTLTTRCGTPGDYQQMKVRLAGIDAPERSQPFGQRSKETLSDLCVQTPAQIMPRTVDRYGRIVPDVSCRGQDAGVHLVRAGMAWVYDKYSKGYDQLHPVQHEAQIAHRDLWIQQAIPPWEWRKAQREQ